MSEKDILSWLKLNNYRKIAELCETTPKSAAEIAKLAKMDTSEVADTLETLERHQAIEHKKEGWKTTELAIRVLNKYFR